MASTWVGTATVVTVKRGLMRDTLQRESCYHLKLLGCGRLETESLGGSRMPMPLKDLENIGLNLRLQQERVLLHQDRGNDEPLKGGL